MKKNNNFLVILMLLIAFSAATFVDVFAQEISNINYNELNNKTPELNRSSKKITGKVIFNPEPDDFFGVSINFSGIGDADVNAWGEYKIYVDSGWTGTATPVVCDESYFDFMPLQIDIPRVDSNISIQDFNVDVSALYTISGTLTDSVTGEPISNTYVVFEKAIGGPYWAVGITTNELGEYSITTLPCNSNTYDPRITGKYYIKPFKREYEQMMDDEPNQDYKVYNYEKPLPPGWFQPSTGLVHTIAVESSSNPDICGVELNLGDLVGVFYFDEFNELQCGGYGRWQDENNVTVQAQGNDIYSNFKDGFYNMETLNWFFYSYQLQENVSANPEFKSGGYLYPYNKFYPGALSIVEQLNAEYPNNIVIPQGWSGLSSFTPPGSVVLTSALASITDELIIIQDMTNMWYPAIGVNNIYTWDSQQGYKIKLSEEAVLPMPGCPLDNTTVSLTTTWNIMPVLSVCNVLITDLFSANMDKVIVIKEIAGNRIYWPDMGISTLQILEPCKAYYVAVSQNTSITYADCGSAKSPFQNTTISPTSNLTSWNNPVNTGSTHTIAFSNDALYKMSNGDYIGAFTQEGNCAGLVQVNDITQNISLTVYGDDILTTEKEGFTDGDNLCFKIFKTQTAEVFNVNAEFDGSFPTSDGMFADNGLSVVNSLKFSSTGISSGNNTVKFYPNPTNGLVEFRTDNAGIYHIVIQNITGEVIVSANISGTTQLNLSEFSKGVYVVKIEGENFINTQKLILK